MKKILLVVLNAFVFPAVSLADSEMSYKAMMMTEPAQTWVSGLKQRTEMKMPMVGQQVVITRVDKGVKWTLNTTKKTYTEEAIALPYTKQTSEANRPLSGVPGSDVPENCTPTVTTLSQTKTIAGLASNGYKIHCKESPQEGTIAWVTPASATTDAVMKEQEAYGKAYTKALFANFPAKERAEMVSGASFLSSVLTQIPNMVDGGKIPKGMWTAFEMESKEEGRQMVYELVKMSAAPVKAGMFEIPAGYKKVESAMSNMDIGEMMKGAGQDVDMESLMKQFGGK